MKLRCLLIILCFLIVFGSAVEPILASDLPHYQQKIKEIIDWAEYLNYPEESSSANENDSEQLTTIKEMRSELPLDESIEFQGKIFKTNHKWYIDKLNEIQGAKKNSTERATLVNELIDSLNALDTKLSELEKQQQSTLTKDEEKQKLDEILKREEFQKPKEPEETWFQQKLREFWAWIKQFFVSPEINTSVENSSPALAKYILYLIMAFAIGLVFFVIYRFSPSLYKKFKKKNKKNHSKRVILGEILAADDNSVNLFADAEKLALEGNLRGAIRKGYIAILCELSDRKIIGLAKNKTNRDYLHDLKNRQDLRDNMNILTHNFERNWYGFAQTNEDEWEEFKRTYRQTMGKA